MLSKNYRNKNVPLPTERLQKMLARVGLGSRREIETWIQAGRVKVNRRTATLGDRVSLNDEIFVDKRKIYLSVLKEQPRRILCYHKPFGEICTRHDPEGRKTIFDKLPRAKYGRWISVGRLDLNTGGLLLLTNDGELAYRLMHPSYNIEREYAVRILGKVDDAVLERLQEGVQLEDGMARFKKIVDAGGDKANHWYRVTLNEGRNHEVRRLWESQGVIVSRLMRIRFGPISLPRGLPTGRYVEFDKPSEKLLLQLVDLYVPSTPKSKPQKSKYQKSGPQSSKVRNSELKNSQKFGFRKKRSISKRR
jgi:23S rRNA pseudouridine2605 synthase